MSKTWSVLCSIGKKLFLAIQCLLVAGVLATFVYSFITGGKSPLDAEDNLFTNLILMIWIIGWSLLHIVRKKQGS